jgi:putative component of toxin-antitoxin plasmid stabilization module
VPGLLRQKSIAPALVILLAGGTKKRQDRDIATAQMRWKDYKKRKSQET